MKLQNRVKITSRVRPIQLHNPKNTSIVIENKQQCIVSGFGTIKDSRQSHVLKYLTVPIVGRDQWYRIHVLFSFQIIY